MKDIALQEFASIIAVEIPEVKQEINHLQSKENTAGLIQIVTTYTKEMLKQKRWEKVKWNMMLLGWIYGNANQNLKELIENIFVRSFKGMERLCEKLEWQFILKKVPANLYAVYIYQNQE